ncbi:hypothetical protein FACS1894154_11890 [Betaproteobacteria bacterium]|nr:hypothetical protein FACS1894154_11890 [Betaproteobacteria bacterium]
MRIVGGGLDIVVGAVACYGTGGLACPIGAVAGLYGADQIAAGWDQIGTRQPPTTYFVQALQNTGLGDKGVFFFDFTTGLGLGLGLGSAALSTPGKVVGTVGDTAGLAANRGVGELININPAELRWTQRTAGGNGRADVLRESIGTNGYSGAPIDIVRTVDGPVTVDHTRAAIALEQGITSIPATVHLSSEALPSSMIGRFGSATTWGEAAAYRAANQRPPLPPTGTTTPPKLPTPKK